MERRVLSGKLWGLVVVDIDVILSESSERRIQDGTEVRSQVEWAEDLGLRLADPTEALPHEQQRAQVICVVVQNLLL